MNEDDFIPKKIKQPTQRQQYHAQVKDLVASGMSIRGAAKKLGLQAGAVLRWYMEERREKRKEMEAQMLASAQQTTSPLLPQPQTFQQEKEISDEQLATHLSRARVSAIATLAKAARGHKVHASAIAAAKMILAQLPVQTTEAKSVLSSAPSHEIAERAIVCACSLIGVSGVQAILNDLVKQEQADLLGGHDAIQPDAGHTDAAQTSVDGLRAS